MTPNQIDKWLAKKIADLGKLRDSIDDKLGELQTQVDDIGEAITHMDDARDAISRVV